MSFWRRKISFKVSGIDSLNSSSSASASSSASRSGVKDFLFQIGTFYVIGIFAAVALVFVAPKSDVKHYGVVSVPRIASSVDLSELEYTDGVSFKLESPEEAFIYPGDASRKVARLKFFSEEGTLRLRDVTLKLEGIDEKYISKAKLKDEEGASFRGYFGDEYVLFKNLFFKIEPGEVYYFDVYMNFSEDLHFGQRLGFQVESPKDLDLTLYGDRVYVEENYPLSGASISVVGLKEVF